MATMITFDAKLDNGRDYQLTNANHITIDQDESNVSVNGQLGYIEFITDDPKNWQYSVSVAKNGVITLCDGDGVIRHAFHVTTTSKGTRFDPISDDLAVKLLRAAS